MVAIAVGQTPQFDRRRRLSYKDHQAARRTVELAWRDLPGPHRQLLEQIGADRWDVIDRAIGAQVDDLYTSAGEAALPPRGRQGLDEALGVWVPGLRLVLIDAGHHNFAGLDDNAYEEAIARVAWHEWGHALSTVRANADDIAAGELLLSLAPAGVAEYVRQAGYRPRELTTELVAEIYALLMARRRRGQTDQPSWLHNEIHSILTRVTGWNP